MKKVLIIGGGLAGLSCAVYLLDKGFLPHILEKNSVVGGRTSSWVENGMNLESGLHRMLGFYKALPQLLEKCGVETDEIIQWMDEIEIRLPDGEPSAVFAISPLGKPLASLLDVLGNNDFVSPKDKILLVKFFAIGLKLYFEDPEELDKYSIVEFAYKHGLNKQIIFRVIEPLTSGLFFLKPEEYSAYVFFGTIGPYIKRIHKFGEGAFKGGMTEVMTQPIAKYIEGKGGIVVKDTKVEGLVMDKKGKARGVKTASGEITADHVVLATDLGSAQALIGNAFPDNGEFKAMLKLKTMPAITVQFELEKPTNPTDRVTFSPGTVWGCYAEQSRTTFKSKSGRLALILSDPKRFIDKQPQEIMDYIKEDSARIGIDLSTIRKYHVNYLPKDFYSLSPGSEKLRPTQKTNIKGLTLAGDYTKQKYLATMEGAVYSGRKAAETVSLELGSEGND